MRSHRLARFVAILILLAALLYLLIGVIGALFIERGPFSSGWGPGWRGWLTIPLLVSAFLSAASLFIFGAVLFFLTKIDDNLSSARRQGGRAAKPAEAKLPIAGPEIKPLATTDVAAGGAAQVELPRVEVEAPSVQLPEVELPKVELPEVEPPKLEIEAPKVEIGAVLPAVESPKIELEAPKVELPKVEIEAPKVELGAMLPEVELPKVEIEAPKVELSEVELPKVEIEAPKIEAGLPEIELSKVEALKVDLPKVAAEAPKVGAAPVDEVATLRAELAVLQARLAQLEGGTAAAAPEVARMSAIVQQPEVKPPQVEAGVGARLPGADEAARIAAEMAALKPIRRRTEPVGETQSAAPTTGQVTQLSAMAPAAEDDLLAIVGIGPTYVRRLRDLGITTFAALAAASDETLEQVARGLASRVAREDWRGQAARLSQQR